MTIGVLVFPGSNCDHDAYHVLKHVCGQDARFVWHKDSDNMQAILNIFRGLAPLADAPEQAFESTTTSSTLPRTTTTTVNSPVPPGITAVPPSSTGPSDTGPVTGDTAPLSNAPETAIVPDATVEC